MALADSAIREGAGALGTDPRVRTPGPRRATRGRSAAPLLQREQALHAHPFRLPLEVEHHAMAEHGMRHAAHVVHVRHGAAIHGRPGLGTQHQVL